MQLHYMIFKYKTETLGLLCHEPFRDIRPLKFIEDESRLKQIVPDIEIETLKKLLHGIKDEVCKNEYFDIEEFTRFYLNDFHFEEMQVTHCDDVDNMVDWLVEFHLK